MWMSYNFSTNGEGLETEHFKVQAVFPSLMYWSLKTSTWTILKADRGFSPLYKSCSSLKECRNPHWIADIWRQNSWFSTQEKYLFNVFCLLAIVGLVGSIQGPVLKAAPQLVALRGGGETYKVRLSWKTSITGDKSLKVHFVPEFSTPLTHYNMDTFALLHLLTQCTASPGTQKQWTS